MDQNIFKAYDVRGIYPTELDETAFRQIGRAFVTFLKAKRIGVGRDMRVSSPALADAFIDGVRSQGADVLDYGMIATDMLYYGVASDGVDGGAQITASHNPKQYNGAKMVGKGNVPLSGDSGISDIRDMIAADRIPPPSSHRGSLSPRSILDGYTEHVMSFIDPSISWRDVEWLRSITKLPVIIKGIVRADDARRAVEAGASGIVVSNHGGRQLDALHATIDALPYVALAAAGRAEVYVDGGIRRGLDVVKAIALGARAVLIGRPVLWGLAADGEHGVARVLEMLQREIDNTMGLCGCPHVDNITADLLRPDSRV